MKLRRVVPATADTVHASVCLGDDTEGALLDSLGDVAGKRVLLLGAHVGIMCELIRRGCLEVTELELNERLDVCAVDLAIVPTIASADAAACAIAHARRALVPCGRTLVRATVDPTGWRGRAIERILRLHGFSLVGVYRAKNRAVFVAKLALSSVPS
jgi:hypothetical protein